MAPTTEGDTLTVEEQFTLLLGEGKDVPVSSSGPSELPDWFDEDRFRRGQLYFSRHYYSLFVGKLAGLLVILAVPSILRVLVKTRRSSSPLDAFGRYLSTLTHMLNWYEDQEFLRNTSRGQKSVTAVRGLHCAAARSSGGISQLDMALTQFGFMGFPVVFPERLGLSAEGQEDFLHFWRVMGHLLGIQERFNVCRENVEECRQLCKLIVDRVFVPCLKAPPADFQHMSSSLLEGMWAVTPAVDCEAFRAFTYYLVGLPLLTTSAYSNRLLALQIFVQEKLLALFWLNWILRPILNFLMWFAIALTQKWQLLKPYLDTRTNTQKNNCYS